MSWKDKFLEKAKKVHGNKYDYSKVEYKDSQTKVCIICPEHGEFWQTPVSHARGYGCPKCGNYKRGTTRRSNTSEFIERARKIHGDKYDYSKVNYVNAETKVCIICPEHGEFWQTPVLHILQGSGCQKCAGQNLSREELINKFINVHGDKYDYSKMDFKKMHEKVCIICPEHGEFWQTPEKHLRGQGCKKCGFIKRGKEKKLTTEEFIEKARKVHGDRYDYSKSVYEGTNEEITITCKIHGDFKEKPNYHLTGHGCPICGYNVSNAEEEIKKFLDELNVNYIHKDRSILGKQEIDIYIPDFNFGIEFDGLYWHNELYKDKDYHLRKTEDCEGKGIKLIHIFEDEWLNKKDIVKSVIANKLGKTSNKIYGRKCIIKEVTNTEKNDFLNNNHLQGEVISKINIGLFYNDELVSLMCFGSKRLNLGFKENIYGEYEMLRFCNKLDTNVIGGASKLLKYFIENYKPKKIISYCDRRYGSGNMYEKLGFKLDHISKPNYYYVQENNRKNRFQYRKSVLVKEGFDKNKSEREIMLERKMYRIYDCGNLVYIWKKEDD